MITLNLLSPENKKELKSKTTFILLEKSLLIIIIFLVVTSVLFYGTKIYQNNKLNNLIKEIEQTKLTLPSGEKVSLSKDVQDINFKLNYIGNIQKTYIKWSDLLADFSNLVPSSITLNSLSLNQQTKTVTIGGNALLRENLVAFQNNLEKANFLSEIESPISNLLKKENIDFSFKAKLNLEKSVK